MTFAIALYFFLISAVMLGLLAVSLPFYKASNIVQPPRLWAITLLLNTLGTFFFALAISITDDLSRPVFVSTIANALLMGANVGLGLFFRSLHSNPSRHYELFTLAFVIGFAVVYELFKTTTNVQGRVAVVGLLGCLTLLWQCIELWRYRRINRSYHILILIVATAFELVMVATRVGLVIQPSAGFRTIAEVPAMIVVVTWIQFAVQVIGYTALNGYWTELVSRANAKIDHENERIKELYSNQEKLVETLTRLNKTAMTGALSASIAHELNQPLQAIQLNAEIAQRKIDALPQDEHSLLRETIREILSDNRRAAAIIASLRGVFLQEGPEARDTDLCEMVRPLEALFQPLASRQGLSIQFKYIDHAFAKVRADEVRQALLNIINNAFEIIQTSHNSGGRIVVSMQRRSPYVEVVVSDNGPGVLPSEADEIFYLLKTSRNSHMGLGLWLSKYITERNDGTITLINPTEGGATFILRFTEQPPKSSLST
jgi:signal transduction histidine kinase